MRRECRERFPCHRGLAIPTCITAREWLTCHDACLDRWITVSFEVGGGENVPGISGEWATCHFTYLVRGLYWLDCMWWSNRLGQHGWVLQNDWFNQISILFLQDYMCFSVEYLFLKYNSNFAFASIFRLYMNMYCNRKCQFEINIWQHTVVNY